MACKSLLPEDIEELKCALCQNYLSVPPIMVISKSGDDYKCGRCQDIRTEVNIRNKVFENIAKLSKFPCIYGNCEEKLSWGTVETHEQICPHKTYRCNILENCSDIIAIDDLETHHIAKQHPGHKMVYEKLEMFVDSSFSVHLLIKNKVPYLIYFEASQPTFWISVFSLKSETNETVNYEVKLSTTANIPLLDEIKTVIPYNEREHCVKCLFMECYLPHHKFSNVNCKGSTSMFYFIQNTYFTLPQGLTCYFDRGGFNCTINILDKPEVPAINQPQLVSRSNDELLQRILQCPICLELMPAEIYTCRIGHVVCSVCKPQLRTCPTCGGEFSDSRNYALEEIAENVALACEYQRRGCSFIGNVENVHGHQPQCSYGSSSDPCSSHT